MTQVSGLSQLFQAALANDQKIDTQEFLNLKATAEQDGAIQADESALFIDALTHNQFQASAVPAVIQFVSQTLEKPTADAAEPPAQAVEAASNPPEQKPASEEKKNPWTKTYELQGSFNHTAVSDGWTDQYGSEKSATKVEGAFKGEINYAEGRLAWKNKLLLEYGNTFVKGDGDTQRAVSRNNLEVTTEVAREIAKDGHWKIEIPYLSLYTKGPVDTIEGRKFRETSGAKISYKNQEAQSDYSLKLGGGIQQFNNPETKKWENEAGVEIVAEAKQSFGILKGPIVSALGGKEEDIKFLNRLEANATVNTFTPLHQGVSLDTTDVTIRTGARYYVNDNKSIWLGVSKEWQYGGQAESTWESKFTTDVGFKFN